MTTADAGVGGAPSRWDRLVEPVVRGAADYRHLAAAKVRSDWQYRASFVALFLSNLLVTAVDFAGIAVLFTTTDTLGDWTLTEVAFLYGTAGICFGVADMMVGSIDSTLAPQIKDGRLDVLLTRPVNVLVNLAAADFSLRRVGRIAQAATVLAAALALNDIDWTPGRAAALVLLIVSGTTIAAAVWVTTASIAFWLVDTTEVANSFTYGGLTAISYPLHVLERWLRIMLTYVVPLVFVNYLPALYILDLESPLAFDRWLRWASPAVAVTLAVIARSTWRAGLRRYTSTGS